MESIDFTGLAARAVAGLHEVRACLLVSRDGLTLAALPEGGEDVARRALDRLDAVGQPERGFLVIGDEVWVVSRRGPYLGIVVAAATAKAGLLLDRLESTLRAAEEARLLAGSAGPGRPEIPRRPRTPLHREPRFDPTRSEVRPPNVFEEMARVVSVPDKEETQRSEPSVGEAAATTAWPHTIREPEAPNVGGPGSGSEPPTIIRPDPRPEPEETKVVTPEPEAEKPEFTAPEPEEPKVATRETAVEESKVTDSEPDGAKPDDHWVEPAELTLQPPDVEAPEPEAAELQPEAEPMLAALDRESEEDQRSEQPVLARQPEDSMVAAPEPELDVTAVDAEEEQKLAPPVGAPVGDVLGITAPEPPPASVRADFPVPETKPPTFQEQLEALELSSPAPETMQEPPTAEPDKADEVPSSPVSVGGPAPMPQLAHPEIEPPKPTPHYSPPDALLGEMGRVVAGESAPADILPPGVTPVETMGTPQQEIGKPGAESPEAKTEEGSKERREDTEVDPVALAREFSQLFDERERNS